MDVRWRREKMVEHLDREEIIVSLHIELFNEYII